MFGHVVVQQCNGGEVAPLTVLEFVPVGNRTDAKAWTEVRAHCNPLCAHLDMDSQPLQQHFATLLSPPIVCSRWDMRWPPDLNMYFLCGARS